MKLVVNNFVVTVRSIEQYKKQKHSFIKKISAAHFSKLWRQPRFARLYLLNKQLITP